MAVAIGMLHLIINTGFTYDLKSALEATKSELESKQKAMKNDVEHNE